LNAFRDYPEFNEYDDVLVLHNNNLSTFVPSLLTRIWKLFAVQYKGFETDFAFDEISNYEINSVYIPYVNMNNFFIDQFGTFDYKHNSEAAHENAQKTPTTSCHGRHC
jgi:hypothetical protein